MKKALFTVAMFAATTLVMAQDAATTTSAPDFKPAAGANNLELNFVPLNGKPIQMTSLRYRRFLTEKTAVRVGFGISYASTSNDSARTSNVDPANTVDTKSKESTFGWNIKPGYEMHFEGTKRLSPYVGGELDLAGQSKKTYVENIDKDDNIISSTTKNASKGGFFRIGVNAVAGFDCYITKHLYLGTELGFGVQFVKYSALKVESDPAPATAVPDVKQGSELNIGPNVNSAIRLGFIF